MGQFDLKTEAALSQLNFEELDRTPGSEFVEIIGDLLKLVGGGGPVGIAGGASNLLLKLRKLAGARYASNLVYTITAVRDDLATLYARSQNGLEFVDSLRNNSEFAEAIGALALQAMHTSVKGRLKRLARIVVNGVKKGDLEPESLDDMLRAATELSEPDINLLKGLYEHSMPMNMDKTYTGQPNRAACMDSVAKLQAVAFVQLRTPGMDMGANIVVLLDRGKRFYERLQEIAV